MCLFSLRLLNLSKACTNFKTYKHSARWWASAPSYRWVGDRQNQLDRPHKDLGDLSRGTDLLESASARARCWNKKTCGERSNTEVLAPARPPLPPPTTRKQGA